MTKRIAAVAGTNDLKIGASREALVGLTEEGYDQADYTVRGTVVGDCPDVPPQPFGLEQTKKGAKYRALAALDADPEAECGIGIENGIISLGDAAEGGLDVPVVALVFRSSPGKVTYASGPGIPVEARHIQASLATGQQKTCGKFIAEETGFNHADWHKDYTGGIGDRRMLVLIAVALAFSLRFTGR